MIAEQFIELNILYYIAHCRTIPVSLSNFGTCQYYSGLIQSFAFFAQMLIIFQLTHNIYLNFWRNEFDYEHWIFFVFHPACELKRFLNVFVCTFRATYNFLFFLRMESDASLLNVAAARCKDLKKLWLYDEIFAYTRFLCDEIYEILCKIYT